MKQLKFFILTLLVCFVSLTASAQDIVCSGTVVDEQGEPIIGASIFQKGSSKGAVSDLDGAFKLQSVPEGRWLRCAEEERRNGLNRQSFV